MKVLKKGRDQKGWTTKRTCTGSGNGGGGCRAKLLVSASDLYKTYRHSYDGCTDTYVTFTCPLCGVETDIENATYEVSGDLPSKQNISRTKNRRI